jgi:parallel beta-helix repeat protein
MSQVREATRADAYLTTGRHRSTGPGEAAARAPGRSRLRRWAALTVAVATAATAGLLSVARGAPSQVVLAEDSFDQQVASGWGTAPVGGPWSATAPLTGLAVDGSAAVVRLAGPQTGRSVWLPQVTARDAVVRAEVTFQTPSAGFGQIAAVTMRKVGRQQEYRARLRAVGDGSLRLSFSKVSAGVERLLAGEVPVGSVTGTPSMTLRAAVSGSTLLAAAWPAAAAEPAGWQARYEDAAPLADGGGVGVWFYAGAGQPGSTTSVTAFRASGTPVESGPAPSPTAAPPVTATATPTSTATASPSPSASSAPAPPPIGSITPAPSPPAAQGRVADQAGAPPVGSTRYPVPADARVVAAAGDDGATGTAAAPWRTIRHAVAAAPDGSTVVVRGGTYHESVVVPYGRRITLQNWPGEAVWLDGSTAVAGWVQEGSAWRRDGWTARFDSSIPGYGSSAFNMLDPAHAMAAHPDQVWVDGNGQRQVGSRAEVGPGTFYVDEAAQRLFLGTSPAGRSVRASDLAEAIYLNHASGSVVRGLGVRRYATPILRYGTVKAFGDGTRLQDLVVEDSATVGIGVKGTGVTVDHTTVRRQGQLGIQAYQSDNLVLTANRVEGNNSERFAEIPVAGGIKITSSRHLRIAANSVRGNGSTGIWLDESCYDARIVSNNVVGSSRHGIYFELSAQAIVADNVVVDSGRSAIRVADSANVRIWNNTVLRAGAGVDIVDGPRVATDLSTAGHDERQPLPDPNVTWIVSDVQVRNLVVDSGGRSDATFLLGANDGNRQRSAATMRITADSDVHVRPPGLPATLVQWSDWPTALRSYSTLAGMRAATGQEARGIEFTGGTGVFVDPAAGDLRLRSDSPARGHGTALPSDIAAALGRSAGAVDPGAFFG